MRYLSIVAIIIAGCATPTFEKPGATTEQFSADRYDCQQQWERTAEAIAFRLDPVGNLYYGIHSRAVLQECMEHKGWTRVEQ